MTADEVATQRATLLANGWTATPWPTRNGSVVTRWFGRAPLYRQPDVGVPLEAAWKMHTAAVDRGLITPVAAPDQETP